MSVIFGSTFQVVFIFAMLAVGVIISQFRR